MSHFEEENDIFLLGINAKINNSSDSQIALKMFQVLLVYLL